VRQLRRAPWQRPKPAVTVRGSTIDPALRALVRDRAGGMCECCGDRLSPIFQAHHRKLRSRGGQDSAANLAALCGLCHRRVHSHVTWATEQGFIVSAFEDPARVPMAVRCEDWRYLTPEGHYLPTDDPAYENGYFPADGAS
jgi:hypothetical protein